MRAAVSGPTLALTLLTVVLSACAQVVLKVAMSAPAVQQAMRAGGMSAVTTVTAAPFVWLGLCIYALSTVLWLAVLARVDVGQAYPFVGLGVVLTLLCGAVFLGEGVSLGRVAGTALVVAGVILVARGA
jgi:multidrug transporter EmrE-like cation transporter